jgi:hypothetical protein
VELAGTGQRAARAEGASGSVTKGPVEDTAWGLDIPASGNAVARACNYGGGCKHAAPRVIEADGGALARIVDGEVHYWFHTPQRAT